MTAPHSRLEVQTMDRLGAMAQVAHDTLPLIATSVAEMSETLDQIAAHTEWGNLTRQLERIAVALETVSAQVHQLRGDVEGLAGTVARYSR